MRYYLDVYKRQAECRTCARQRFRSTEDFLGHHTYCPAFLTSTCVTRCKNSKDGHFPKNRQTYKQIIS